MTTTTTTAAANTTAAGVIVACQATVRRVLGDTPVAESAPHQAYTAFDALWATRPTGFSPSAARRVLTNVLAGQTAGYGLSYLDSKPAKAARATPAPSAPVTPAPAPTPAPAAPVADTAEPTIVDATPLELVDEAFERCTCEGHVVVLLDAANLAAETARKRIAAATPKPAAVTPPAPAKPAPAPVTAPAIPLAEIHAYCQGKDATLGGLRELCARSGVVADTKSMAAMKAALLAWKPAVAPAPKTDAKPAPAEQPKPAAAPAPEAPKPTASPSVGSSKPAPAPAPVVVKAARTAKAIAESIDNGDKLVSLKTPELACLATLYNINPAAPEFSGKGGRARLVSAVATARKEAKAAAAAKGKPATEPAKGGMSEAVRGLLRELRGELAGNVDALAALALVEEAASK